MISLSRPILGSKEVERVRQVLLSGQLAQGKLVADFESQFAKMVGTKYAVAVNNGTAALHTALYAAAIEPEDEVITTPFTFVASANCILMVGATPVFVDIDPQTYNIDPKKIEKAITKKTKAIIVVNLFGQPAEFEEIIKIGKKYRLLIVEDAAQSIGAQYKTKKSGNLGDIGCFSLYATKNITSGEGGILTTNSRKLYQRIILFRNHGQNPRKKYDYKGLGYNYRMTEFQAAIALEQLKKLKRFTQKRISLARLYDTSLSQIKDIVIPHQALNRTHVYHQYTIRITKGYKPSREKLLEFLGNNGVGTAVFYPMPLYRFPHLNIKKYTPYQFPVSEKACQQVLSLPIHPTLRIKDIKRIANLIRKHSEKS